MIVRPDGKGEKAAGITAVLHSSTELEFSVPRVFKDDTAEDKKAIEPVLSQIQYYPLSEFDGKMKTKDWSKLPNFPAPPSTGGETKWIVPEKFCDISARLVENGARVLTSLDGRSAATIERASAAGMEDASPETITTADFILSIVPPGEALALAEGLAKRLSESRHKPVFIDCNCPKSENQDTGRRYACRNGVRCYRRGYYRRSATAGRERPKVLRQRRAERPRIRASHARP
jgi:hypothetical protein